MDRRRRRRRRRLLQVAAVAGCLALVAAGILRRRLRTSRAPTRRQARAYLEALEGPEHLLRDIADPDAEKGLAVLRWIDRALRDEALARAYTIPVGGGARRSLLEWLQGTREGGRTLAAALAQEFVARTREGPESAVEEAALRALAALAERLPATFAGPRARALARAAAPDGLEGFAPSASPDPGWLEDLLRRPARIRVLAEGGLPPGDRVLLGAAAIARAGSLLPARLARALLGAASRRDAPAAAAWYAARALGRAVDEEVRVHGLPRLLSEKGIAASRMPPLRAPRGAAGALRSPAASVRLAALAGLLVEPADAPGAVLGDVAAHDPEPRVRRAAARTLAHAWELRPIPALVDLAGAEDRGVAAEAAAAMAIASGVEIEDPSGGERPAGGRTAWQRLHPPPDAWLDPRALRKARARWAAWWKRAGSENPRDWLLEAALGGPETRSRAAAWELEGLLDRGPEAARPWLAVARARLVAGLAAPRPWARRAAARILARGSDPDPLLGRLREEGDPDVREEILRSAGAVLGDRFTDAILALVPALEDEPAWQALERIVLESGPRAAADRLATAFRAGAPALRRRIAAVLGRVREVPAVETLLAGLEDADPQVRFWSGRSLRDLGGGADLGYRHDAPAAARAEAASRWRREAERKGWLKAGAQ